MQAESRHSAGEHGMRIPDTWTSSSGSQVPIRRMIDDFIRQGWNDDRIVNYVSAEYTDFIVQVGFRSADVNWL